MYFDKKFDEHEYPLLSAYTTPVKLAERPIIGREEEMRRIGAAMARPELCNIMLLGDAGSGKTALTQGCTAVDASRYYIEVNLSRMIADLVDANQMADKLKGLFDETAVYCAKTGKQLVLFIDEFHQIVQLSPAAVEVLKPLLADSGTRGIRVIAATTYLEFRQWISPNQPLVERLQRITLAAPSKEMVVSILKGMAKRYGVDNKFPNDSVFEAIYDLTNRYVPANAQPRKSILVLDTMIGWYRVTKCRMDFKLLSMVIEDSEGISLAFDINASAVKRELDKHVFAQQAATSVIEHQLQTCIADLNDKSKPMASFLFSGATGCGKTEMTKQLAKILFNDSKRLIRFDMSEYANADSLDTFRHELTNRVWERPYSIILLDEIEKACAPVTRLLLQVLDDGRLTDINNREVTFVNSYIVLTTNAGSEVYKTIAQYAVDDNGSGKSMQYYEKLIRKSIVATGGNRFPPELLGRIDAIVPFQPLSEATQHKIVEAKLFELMRTVRSKHNVTLQISEKVKDYLVGDMLDTDSNAGGARAAVSKFKNEVVANVARALNQDSDARVLNVYVCGEMASENKNQLESKAYIRVEKAQ